MERSNLPEDLIEEILSRAPAKSLVRWLSASKRWNARLNSEIFAKRQSSNAPNESSLIITLMDFRVYLVKPNLQRDSDKRLVVWNPCSRETKWIKPRTRYHYKKYDCYALGYDNKSPSKQYKILRVYGQGGVGIYYEIYDFTTDSWRDVFCTDRVGLTLFNGKRCSVSMKGNTYWLVGFARLSRTLFLSFDFSTERFIRLSEAHRYPFSVETLSVYSEDELCKCATTLTEIYLSVTRIRTGSVFPWSKKIFVTNASLNTDYDFSNGSSVLANEKNKLVLCFNNYITIDPHGGNSTCKSPCPLLLNYVPSLTRIQQGTRTGLVNVTPIYPSL